MTDKEIEILADIEFGFNSATEIYRGWVQGFKFCLSHFPTSVMSDEVKKLKRENFELVKKVERLGKGKCKLTNNSYRY